MRNILIIAALLTAGCDGVTVEHQHTHTHGRAVKARPAKQRRTPAAPTLEACPGGRCPVQVNDRRYRSIYGNAVPYVDVPMSMRPRNHSGGSCVHVSLETVFNIQHEYDWAKWWRANYAGGEYVSGLTGKLEKAGWRFAYAEGGGQTARQFIKDCCDLRLGCVIGIPSGHAQTLVGRDNQYFYVVNNNGSGKVDKYTHERFYSLWQGWAVTVIGNPPPPEPFL